MSRKVTTSELEAKLARMNECRAELMRKLQESRKADEARARREERRRQATGAGLIESYVGRPLSDEEYLRLAHVAIVMASGIDESDGGDNYAELLQEIEAHSEAMLAR